LLRSRGRGEEIYGRLLSNLICLWNISRLLSYFNNIFLRLPQIGAAKFIVLGSRIVSFGLQLRYFFGQLNYLFWTANLFIWAALLIIWAAKFINGQQLFFLLNF
jgi:hypothetical protein